MLTARQHKDACDVSLRAAGWRDVQSIWRWNNASEVRAVGLEARPIPLDEHHDWYAASLSEPGHYMWVIEADGTDVGVVRIDFRKLDVGVVSIALESSARGRGIGRNALARACARALALRPDEPLEARIADTNQVSARCFESCGFRWARAEHHADRTFNVYCWEAK